MGTELVVAYDSSCGPCTSFKRALDFLDPKGRIGFVSLIEADREGSLERIPSSRRFSSFHTIFPDGRVESGALAVPDLVVLLPMGRFLSNLIKRGPGGRTATAWLYATLSRLHGSGSCRTPQA